MEELGVVYGGVVDRVSRELAIKAVEAIRDAIGYEVALVITFLKEEPEITHDIAKRESRHLPKNASR